MKIKANRSCEVSLFKSDGCRLAFFRLRKGEEKILSKDEIKLLKNSPIMKSDSISFIKDESVLEKTKLEFYTKSELQEGYSKQTEVINKEFKVGNKQVNLNKKSKKKTNKRNLEENLREKFKDI